MLFPTLPRSELLRLSPLATALFAVEDCGKVLSELRRFGRFGIAHGDLSSQSGRWVKEESRVFEGSSLTHLERRLSLTMSNAKADVVASGIVRKTPRDVVWEVLGK